jgi:hypothetical protein
VQAIQAEQGRQAELQQQSAQDQASEARVRRRRMAGDDEAARLAQNEHVAREAGKADNRIQDQQLRERERYEYNKATASGTPR